MTVPARTFRGRATGSGISTASPLAVNAGAAAAGEEIVILVAMLGTEPETYAPYVESDTIGDLTWDQREERLIIGTLWHDAATIQGTAESGASGVVRIAPISGVADVFAEVHSLSGADVSPPGPDEADGGDLYTGQPGTVTLPLPLPFDDGPAPTDSRLLGICGWHEVDGAGVLIPSAPVNGWTQIYHQRIVFGSGRTLVVQTSERSGGVGNDAATRFEPTFTSVAGTPDDWSTVGACVAIPSADPGGTPEPPPDNPDQPGYRVRSNWRQSRPRSNWPRGPIPSTIPPS